MTLPIPAPQALPVLGHLLAIDAQSPVQSLTRLLRDHGPIAELRLPGRRKGGRLIVVGSYALADELSDQERFDKQVHDDLEEIRAFAGDGLFTAETAEPNWRRAHNILMPAFGPLAIRGMFGQMQDVCEQMLLRWERFGPAAEFDVADQMTRLTLDTIALCAFDYRFNSFYLERMHPFVDAMVGALDVAGKGGLSSNPLHLNRNRQYRHDLAAIREIADDLIRQRQADPQADEKDDLLALMLRGRDPETGEGLSLENVRNQMVTFLIAGHETTSGLLSFAVHFLLRDPEVLRRAREEVDRVLGDRAVRVTDLPKLTYLDQVLRETLRLWPTAPAFGLRPRARTIIGGRYEVYTDDTLLVLLPALHRDLAVWGPDVDRFDPERFAPDALEALPTNAWKPFGNGQRACIGQPFAMQEALLVLASVLQRFDLTAARPDAPLKVKETLTLKPHDLRLRARLRGGTARPGQPDPADQSVAQITPTGGGGPLTAEGIPLLVLYGSESGASEGFARQIAGDAAAHGCQATVHSLDEQAGTGSLPTQGAVVIVTSSYSGQPPANARRFMAWAQSLGAGALAGVQYAVFGCGNRDWAATYQAVPKQLDALLEDAGARRFRGRGEADARGDFFGGFADWYATFWIEFETAFGPLQTPAPGPATDAGAQIQRGARPRLLRQGDLQTGRVTANRELVSPDHPQGRSKRHLDIELPEGMTYRAGDYLAVLPDNPADLVERVLRRFNVAPDDQVAQAGRALGFLPGDLTLSAGDLLTHYTELTQPATRRQVERLRDATRCPPERQILAALADGYDTEVLAQRLSVLDLLERVQGCELDFAEFLEMLPPLRARQYSVSSSPLLRPGGCSLTVAVVDAPAHSGTGRFRGVASGYLQSAQPGTRLTVAVRPSADAFHLPEDSATPLILVCAGTGVAPFRGFLEERALRQAGGETVGEALLFFGCDHPDLDFLYRDELLAWQERGVVSVRLAFSQQPEDGVEFVQHRLWQDRADVARLFRQGAHLYVCGDGRFMAPAVRETLVRIYQEETGVTEADAQAWAEAFGRDSGRYAADVFA